MTWRTGWLLLLAACGGGPVTEQCTNGFDDDGNGLIDCADIACASPSCLEICDDGIDNNANGLPDCTDPQCDGVSCGEQCDDGRDNDRNGAVDCADTACAAECDADGDSFLDGARGGTDCDDDNPAIHPAAPELCNGIDDNCNELVDREDPEIDPTEVTLWHLDADGDGYGSQINALYECDQPADRVANGDDCDDDNAQVNPLTPEVCNERDDNCDGLIDDADPLVDLAGAATWYPDSDSDGFGDAASPVVACARPSGHVSNDDDCNDADPTALGASLWVLDSDGDGYGDGVPVGPLGCSPPGPDYVPDWLPLDCDDADAGIWPGAFETCGDGFDSDCDGNDCSEWDEDFETGVLEAEWTTGGNAVWLVQGNTVNSGVFAAECGNIGDNQNTWMQVSLDYTLPGDIAFWHRGSTEAGFDFLQFYVDGGLQQQWSGTWAWTETTVPLSAGTHTLEWRYTKDFIISGGSDTVWVDDIHATGGLPSP